jgi:hypothetical protein
MVRFDRLDSIVTIRSLPPNVLRIAEMDGLIHLLMNCLSVFRKSLPSTSRNPTRIHLSSCEPRRLKYKDLLGTIIWRRKTTSSGLLSGRSVVRVNSRGNRVESLYSSRGCDKGDDKTRRLAKRTCSILTDVAESTAFINQNRYWLHLRQSFCDFKLEIELPTIIFRRARLTSK